MTLAKRLNEVKEKIASAAKLSGRDPDDITLIVVTKNHPAELVGQLLDLGQHDFGENRDQEALPKAQALRDRSDQIVWHFIGQLQSNKVKSVIGYASYLHSLDRDSLLEELLKRCSPEDPLGVFIQVNLTSDPARGGIDPKELEPFAERVAKSQNLRLQGLMGVAGLGIDPRVDFEKLANLSQVVRRVEPNAKGLSMGMSGDYEAAISLGATHLRIGSAITGNRPQ